MSAPLGRQFPARAQAVYGSNDVEALFPGGAPTTSVPWPQAARTKSRPRVADPETMSRALSAPPPRARDLARIDPRDLHASQPGLQRAAVKHYMSPDYERGGSTFADKDQRGNQVPVVYRRPSTREPGSTEDVIMSGHHRAAAALLQGRQFRAHLVEGP